MQTAHFYTFGPCSPTQDYPLSVVRTVYSHSRPFTLDSILETEFKKFRVREFSKSVDIIKEGDDGDEIFVLEEGKIEVYYTEDDGSE